MEVNRFPFEVIHIFVELNLRISAFFSTASVSGAFSGLLAFGIINMDGIGARPGWAWIFILEGLFTVLFGISSYFLLPRSPMHARFFNNMEKEYVVNRLRATNSTDHDEHDDKFSWHEVGQALRLPQVGMLAIIFFFDGEIFIVWSYN
jgi:MFS family permease